MTGVIIDNSVWQRLAHQPAVLEAYVNRLHATPPGEVLVCDAQAAEIGFSAPSAPDHTTICQLLQRFPDCPVRPLAADVLDLQQRLWAAGLVRAVGAVDTVIAAHALANDAVVVHYDSDFEHVARVQPRLRHRWIVPRGTL